MQYVTLEEILSQPTIWQAVLEIASQQRGTFEQYLKQAAHKEAVFIGCGTSYYLSLSAAGIYTMVTGQKARAASASEVLFFPETIFPASDQGYMPVLISRSGMTTEVVRAAEEIQSRLENHTYGVSCRPASDLIRVCHYPLLVSEADEKSVVMTRSFTSMLLLIQLLAAIRSGNTAFEEELSRLPDLGTETIDRCHDLVKDVTSSRQYTKFVYLGQGPYYGLACEAMLKIKEMSLSYSEAYHSLEFRHGPVSMVDEEMLITFLISEQARTEEVTLLKEMKELGARTLVIAEEADAGIRRSADYVVELKSGLSDTARMILYMPIVQLMGYYNAVAKGLDPDNPKNLTQVVTL